MLPQDIVLLQGENKGIVIRAKVSLGNTFALLFNYIIYLNINSEESRINKRPVDVLDTSQTAAEHEQSGAGAGRTAVM